MREQITLRKGELIKIPQSDVIRVERGSIWATFEGRPQDYILKAGEELSLSGRGLLIEAFEESTFTIAIGPVKGPSSLSAPQTGRLTCAESFSSL